MARVNKLGHQTLRNVSPVHRAIHLRLIYPVKVFNCTYIVKWSVVKYSAWMKHAYEEWLNIKLSGTTIGLIFNLPVSAVFQLNSDYSSALWLNYNVRLIDIIDCFIIPAIVSGWRRGRALSQQQRKKLIAVPLKSDHNTHLEIALKNVPTAIQDHKSFSPATAAATDNICLFSVAALRVCDMDNNSTGEEEEVGAEGNISNKYEYTNEFAHKNVRQNATCVFTEIMNERMEWIFT